MKVIENIENDKLRKLVTVMAFSIMVPILVITTILDALIAFWERGFRSAKKETIMATKSTFKDLVAFYNISYKKEQ